MNLLLLINYYCHTLSKNRSMAVRHDPRKGIKMSKEQITVLLACSADGYKLSASSLRTRKIHTVSVASSTRHGSR